MGFDHLGGGGGGFFPSESPFIDDVLLISSDLGSFLLSKLRVFGLVGLDCTGVEGSACLKVLIRGFKFNTKSASGLEAAEGGGL